MEIKYNVQAPPKNQFHGGSKSEEVKAIEDFLTSGNAKNMCFQYESAKAARTKLSTISSHRRKYNEKNSKGYDAYRGGQLHLHCSPDRKERMMNMKTRFDGTLWIGAGGQAFRPAEMGTDHLLNTVKMLKNRPGVVVSMVVRDIEATPDCCPFDPFGGGHSELVKQSLFNITSLSPEQVSDYALNSPLGMAMKAELLSRGVNVENYLSMIEGPETL